MLCSFSNLSVTSRTSQLIFQPFRRFTYATVHSPTPPLLHLRHSSFSNPSFASPTSQALHLIHLESRLCSVDDVQSNQHANEKSRSIDSKHKTVWRVLYLTSVLYHLEHEDYTRFQIVQQAELNQDFRRSTKLTPLNLFDGCFKESKTGMFSNS